MLVSIILPGSSTFKIYKNILIKKINNNVHKHVEMFVNYSSLKMVFYFASFLFGAVYRCVCILLFRT